MINRSKPHNGLGDFFVARRKRKPGFFDAVESVMNCEPINKFLSKKLNRKANVVGNPAYPALLMFKETLIKSTSQKTYCAFPYKVGNCAYFVRRMRAKNHAFLRPTGRMKAVCLSDLFCLQNKSAFP